MPSVEVSEGERPDLAVLKSLGGPAPLSLSLKLSRPRWPYCSRPWCPGNRAYEETRGVYVAATEPLGYRGRVRVYRQPRGPGEALEPLPAATAAPVAAGGAALLDTGKYDVLVVGGGLAGLEAARAAAEYGARVLLASREPVPGRFARLLPSFARLASERLEKLESSSGVAVAENVVYIGFYDEGHALLSGGSVALYPHGRPVVYAGGAEPGPPLVSGNDLPGVVSSLYLLELLHSGYKPRRVVLLGYSPLAGEILSLLERVGVEAVLVAPRGAPRLPETPPGVEAFTASRLEVVGGERVEAVVADGDRVPADLVASVMPLLPDAQPAYMAGYAACYREPGSLVPELPRPSREWLGSRLNVIPAGGSAGAQTVEEVVATARYAGVLAAYVAGRASEEDARAEYDSAARLVGPAACRGVVGETPVIGWASPTAFVDLEEDVTLSALLDTWDRGYHSLEMVKRVTGLGMGADQGRMSLPLAAIAVSAFRRVPLEKLGIPRPRPPLLLPQVQQLL